MDTQKFLNLTKLIHDEHLREWTRYWLDERTPDYFWDVPASSTGKYHPEYTLGRGGLVRHCIVAVKIANELMTYLEPYKSWPRSTKDSIISALILHDTRKHGYPEKSRYSNASHGKDLCDIIWSEYDEDTHPFEVGELVASHMGQWNTSYTSNKTVAPRPVSKEQQFVHLCDYLASRKYLNVDFHELP